MNNIEIIKEVVTVASILIKFDSEDILEGSLFWSFLAELGIKTPGGVLINKYHFNKALNALSENNKREILEEFNTGFEGLYRQIEMYTK